MTADPAPDDPAREPRARNRERYAAPIQRAHHLPHPADRMRRRHRILNIRRHQLHALPRPAHPRRGPSFLLFFMPECSCASMEKRKPNYTRDYFTGNLLGNASPRSSASQPQSPPATSGHPQAPPKPCRSQAPLGNASRQAPLGASPLSSTPPQKKFFSKKSTNPPN